MIIKTLNNLQDSSPRTFLSTTVNSGGTQLAVKNINGFSPDWGIQIGETGQEQSEMAIIGAAALSDGTLNLTSALRFEHPEDTPIYSVKFSQVIFKRSTTGTAGTATGIGTVTIQADSQFTQYDDTSGVSNYAYKTTFYNPVLAVESSESDWTTSSGYTPYSLYKLRDRIKSRLFSSNYIKDPQDMDNWINEWLERMNNTAIDVNEDYSMGTTSVGFSGTAEYGTITATDFKQIRRYWYTNNGTNFYAGTKMEQTQVLPDQSFNETQPYFFMMGDNVIGRRPNETSGTANINYYKTSPQLVNDADELPVYMRNYTTSFIDYCHGLALQKDGKMNEGEKKLQRAEYELERFKKELTPRVKTGSTIIDIVEETGELSEAW